MEEIRLAEIVGPENVAVRFPASSGDDVFEKLVSLLPVEPGEMREAILGSVREREKIQSTGIGYSIAIPHGEAEIDAPLLSSIVLTAEPVEYDSVDGSPVSIFILMVSRPDVTAPHVQALASVARRLGHREFREKLLACSEPEDVVRLLRGEVPK